MGHTPPAALAAIALLAIAAAPDGDDAAAIARGQKSLAWVRSHACPTLGTRLDVAGLATPADIERVRRENWSYANTRLAAMAEAIRARRVIGGEVAQQGGQRSASMRQSFADLDTSIAATSARATSALAQWMLANWVEMSTMDSGIDLVDDGASPLQRYTGDAAKLDTLASGFGGALTPLVVKYKQCIASIQEQVIDYNAAQIRSAASAATTVAAINTLLARLGGIDVDPDSAGGAIVAELRGRRDIMIAEQQHQADLRAAQASASARAALAGDAQETQAVAARYVTALSAGRVDVATALLAENVVLASPRGNAQGKAAVAERMHTAGSSGKQAQISVPQIDGNYQVFSSVSGDSGSGRMYFTAINGRLSSIRLVQN